MDFSLLQKQQLVVGQIIVTFIYPRTTLFIVLDTNPENSALAPSVLVLYDLSYLQMFDVPASCNTQCTVADFR